MISRVLTAGVLVLAVVATQLPVAAHQSSPQTAEDEVRLSAEEVMIDLVVTGDDKKPVTDLRADEVEVYESGDRQEITSFGLVQAGGPAAPTGAAAATPSAPVAIELSPFRGFNYIVLVVDRTSLNQRDLAATMAAAQKFFDEALTPNDLVSVFVVGSRLVMVQNFTNNKERLVAAMKLATDGKIATPDFAVTDRLARQAQISRQITDPASALVDPGASAAQAISDLNTFSNSINEAFDTLSSQFQSFAIVSGLLSLMKVYSRIPGRKSVLFYSEGFAVDTSVEGAFASLVTAANRNNFAFYTVDAGGLRPDPVRRDLGISSSGTLNSGAVGGGDRSIVDAMGRSGLGRAETDIRTGGGAALHRLAVETSGVPIRNSNDLNRGFRAVETDLRSYYALTYAPMNTTADGKFRPIEVKVRRPGVDVRARKGYYATPGGSNDFLLPFEQPILAMLAESRSSTRPTDLPATVRVDRFRVEKGWAIPIALHLDASALTPAAPSADGKEARRGAEPPLRFELDAVAIVRDSKNQVVAKLSRSFLYSSPKEQLEQFRRLELTNTFTKALVLPPGTYTVSVGVFDPNGNKGSVLERAILVPAPRPGEVLLSSLVLSRDVVPVAESERAAAVDDPLVFEGTTRIVPNVTGRFLKSRGDNVVAYFKFYGEPGKRYTAQIQLSRGGQVVNASQPVELPAADARGETGYAPTIPVAGLDPATYMIKVVVSDGDKAVASATANFKVEP